MPHFDAPKIYSFQNIVRKGEIASNTEALFPFLTMFLPYVTLIFHLKCTLRCRLQSVSVRTSLKFCCLVMGFDTSPLCTELNETSHD